MLNHARRSIPIDGFEAVDSLHGLEFFLNLTLVLDEAAVHVRRPVHVHSRFPIVQNQVLPQVPFNENFRTHGQVKDGVRDERNAVHLTNPCRLNASYDGPGHQRVDIAVGKNDKARAKRRNDYILELVGEIGGIEQTERSRAENVSAHRLLEFAANEHGSLQSDVYRGVTAPLEPIAK